MFVRWVLRHIDFYSESDPLLCQACCQLPALIFVEPSNFLSDYGPEVDFSDRMNLSLTRCCPTHYLMVEKFAFNSLFDDKSLFKKN